MGKRLAAHCAFLSLGVFLLTGPVFLLAGAHFYPDQAACCLLPAACAAALSLAARAMPKGLRTAGAAAAILLSILCCLPLDRGSGRIAVMLLCAVCAALHIRLLGLPYEHTVLYGLWYAGFGVYPAARFIAAVTHSAEILPLLRLFAYGYFVFSLCFLARQSLWGSTRGTRAPSRLSRLRSGGAALLLSALMLLLTHIPQLAEWLRAGLRAIGQAVRWLLSLLDFGGNTPLSAPGSGSHNTLLLPEAGEPSRLLHILEKIAFVLAAAAAAVLLLLLLRAVFRLLYRTVCALWARLKAYAGAVTDAYEDTVESLIDWGEMGAVLRRSRKKKRAARKEALSREALAPRERVRRSFRIYLTRHPEVPESRTARQALGENELSALYEAARYSSESVTAEAAERARALENQ